MIRSINVSLRDVTPTPHSLRVLPHLDAPSNVTDVDLGRLFLHYYQDSFPSGPPKVDPTRFEYLELIADSDDFRFRPFLKDASGVKKRAISTEIGQAFCRLMLSDHFGIRYFAHMAHVLGKPIHRAFGGLHVRRIGKGDVPDYLVAKRTDKPLIAEAKGRFEAIGFDRKDFQEWRDQFNRIVLEDRSGRRSLKGFIVATRFLRADQRRSSQSTVYIEDPATPGEGSLLDEQSVALGRMIVMRHYARTFSKLDLTILASALTLGYPLTRELAIQIPVWTCLFPPFAEKEFIGGFYRTRQGQLPQLTQEGWKHGMELGQAHAAFVGLDRAIAESVAAAARGQEERLDDLPTLAPEGVQASEFSWLEDGTVMAPLAYFLPTGVMTL
jgi:hypothetical protein